jgi:hypothetical protein
MWKTYLGDTKDEATTIKMILALKLGDRFWEILKIVLSKAM